MKYDYWLTDENPQEVVSKMETLRGKHAIASNHPSAQAVYRNLAIYYSAIVEPDSFDTGLTFGGEQG
jgi:hypothetical protein